MLLEIDHIAFSSLEFDKHIHILQSIGFKIDLKLINVKNLQIKNKFLRNFSQEHDLAHLKSKNSFNLELINHRQINQVIPNLIPIIDNLPKDLIQNKSRKITENIGFKAVLRDFDIPIYVQNNKDSNFQFNKLLLKTYNVATSKKFFENLGWKEVDGEEDLSILEFKTLFSEKKYFLYLQKSEKLCDVHLDDFGPNCIAFISNSITKEKKLFQKYDCFITPIQKLELNKKELKIFFVRGPNNEILEIISPYD